MRIGFLCDTVTVPKWQASMVESLVRLDGVDFAALVVHGLPPNTGPTPRGRHFVGRVLGRLERRRLASDEVLGDFLEPRDISDLTEAHIAVSPVWSASGFSWTLDENDAAKLRHLDFDILIRLGSGIIRGHALDIAKSGIWSFHHGDNRKYRGLPPGFWEVMNQESRSGYVIQRLSDELDGGSILTRGSVSTQTYFQRNQAHLYTTSTYSMVRLVERLIDQGSGLEEEEGAPYSGPLWRDPSLIELLRYAVVQASRLIRRRFLGRIRKPRRWHVALCFAPWTNAVLRKGIEVPAARGTWIADPFVIKWQDEVLLFVEEFDMASGRGHIAVFIIDGQHATRVGIALKETFHLSFPFVFEDEGLLYMCPETSESNEVRLYRCDGDLTSWTLVDRLAEETSAADPLVLRDGNDWVLLANVDESGSGDFATNLFVWRSEKLVGGSWTREPAPALTDSAAIRNGGVLRSPTGTVRVGQTAQFDEYGSTAMLHRIVHLGPPYREQVIAELTPTFAPHVRGIHHVSGIETVTAFDFYRQNGQGSWNYYKPHALWNILENASAA